MNKLYKWFGFSNTQTRRLLTSLVYFKIVIITLLFKMCFRQSVPLESLNETSKAEQTCYVTCYNGLRLSINVKSMKLAEGMDIALQMKLRVCILVRNKTKRGSARNNIST